MMHSVTNLPLRQSGCADVSACGLCVLLIVLGGGSPSDDRGAPTLNPPRRGVIANVDLVAKVKRGFTTDRIAESVSDAETRWNPASDDEDRLRRNPRRQRRMYLPPPPVLNDRDDSQSELHGGSSLHPVGFFVPPTEDDSALSRLVDPASYLPIRRDRIALYRRYRL